MEENNKLLTSALEYSFNTESLLFPHLTPEQQELWRREIENAFNAGMINKENEDVLCYEEIFEEGAKWKYEQLAKHSVDCDVFKKDDGYADLRWTDENGLEKLIKNFNDGDKVKLIIVKK